MILYKYCDERGIRILEDLRLKITPPNEFNDPFELTPRSRFTMTENELKERIRRDPEHVRPVYVQMRGDGYAGTFDEFIHRLLTDPAFLQFAAIRKSSRTELQKFDAASLDEASQYLGLLCLSKPRNSIPMWSYYGAKHKGMVIGIEVATRSNERAAGFGLNGPFGPVKYCKRRRDHDPYLDESHPKWAKQLGNILFTKSVDWKHEQEYRRVFLLQELITDFRAGKWLYFLPIDAAHIREIVFGCWIDKDVERSVRAALGRYPKMFSHVQLFRCMRHRTAFELEIVPT